MNRAVWSCEVSLQALRLAARARCVSVPRGGALAGEHGAAAIAARRRLGVYAEAITEVPRRGMHDAPESV